MNDKYIVYQYSDDDPCDEFVVHLVLPERVAHSYAMVEELHAPRSVEEPGRHHGLEALHAQNHVTYSKRLQAQHLLVSQADHVDRVVVAHAAVIHAAVERPSDHVEVQRAALRVEDRVAWDDRTVGRDVRLARDHDVHQDQRKCLANAAVQLFGEYVRPCLLSAGSHLSHPAGRPSNKSRVAMAPEWGSGWVVPLDLVLVEAALDYCWAMEKS